ncbi:hypothetical protein OUZ56_011390 [Daphnia magna]|uniref:GMP synthase n=1 Tax=Daphnia magna TaxID=35525 RepID=A0ABQ9Z088_9CRUS|nr:hypothetical protein OUZ56_011390 [Daphnia magna]
MVFTVASEKQFLTMNDILFRGFHGGEKVLLSQLMLIHRGLNRGSFMTDPSSQNFVITFQRKMEREGVLNSFSEVDLLLPSSKSSYQPNGSVIHVTHSDINKGTYIFKEETSCGKNSLRSYNRLRAID